ncbi:MAG: VanW family protein [Anaerolineae bacterium]|nr:VanW family protein [Anaerolineae bacterium]
MSAPNVPYPRQSPESHNPYVHPQGRPPISHPNPWLVRFPLLVGFGLILLAFVLVIMLAGYEFLHHDEIYPGVSTVFGVNLAGMTRQEAITALSEQFVYDSQAAVTFRFGDQNWTYTAGDLGVSLDVEATVDAAYNAGREDNFVSDLFKQWDMRTHGYVVTPVVIYNQTEAERILTEIANNFINRPTLDATLTVLEGRAVATPSQVGRTVDVPATLGVLRQQMMAMSTISEIPLSVHEAEPAVRETDAAAGQINLALSAPVELYLGPGDPSGKGPWVALPDAIQQMIIVEPVTQADDTASYDVSVDLDEARAFLTDLAPELTVQPVNARFIFDDETHQLEVIQPSVNGRILDIEMTVAQFYDAVFAPDSADRRVQLMFSDLPAQVSDTATAAELGITEMVVQKTTYYYGSTSARQRNIQVAASNFHGIVIPPGGEFSFNEWLGDVSAETGYEQGLIIVGNQTITGVGGGVCQVATTAFQTAFYGGYPIMERVEHAYRVSYYEEGEGAGMDATVYSPIVDFRFMNDTPYYLLIETYVNTGNATVTWKFYSTSMNRRVVKEGPIIKNQTSPPPPIFRANAALSSGQVKQVDYSVSGADVYVYRTVYQDDQVIIDHEAFTSHYVPWADQFEVAPGDPRING